MLLNIGLKSREIGSQMIWLAPISAPRQFSIPMMANIYALQWKCRSDITHFRFIPKSGSINIRECWMFAQHYCHPNYIYSYPKPTVPYYYHFWMLMANKLSFKINYLELIGINQEDYNTNVKWGHQPDDITFTTRIYWDDEIQFLFFF